MENQQSKLNKAVKISIIIGILILFTAVTYYVAIFLPQKKAIFEQQKQEQQNKIVELEAIKNEQQSRLDEQKIIDAEQQKQIEELKQQQQPQQKAEGDKNNSDYLTKDQYYCQSGANAYTKKAYDVYKKMPEEARKSCEDSNDRNGGDEDCDKIYKARKKTSDEFMIAYDAYHKKCD